jgi:serine protease
MQRQGSSRSMRVIQALFVLVAPALLMGACCQSANCKIARPLTLQGAGAFTQMFPQKALPDEIIVKLKAPGVGRPSVLQSSSGLTEKAGSRQLLLVKLTHDKEIAPAARVERLARSLSAIRALPEVQYAHQNFVVQAFEVTPNDTCWTEGRLWSYRMIGLPTAWEGGTTGARVAVVDTGLVPKHCDFDGANILPGYNFVERGTNPMLDLGTFHGSHVAGTIGAVKTNNGDGLSGVNWAVGVQPVRVLNNFGSGSLYAIIEGIRWAAGLPVDDAGPNTTPARVINLSLGGQFRCSEAPALQDAINEAVAQGAVVVAAAGNSAMDAREFSPAGCDNVLTVAGAGPEGNLAYYSNFGDTVEILAPGGEVFDSPQDEGRGILSTVLGGYAYFQGTSMAAPHVSAVLALTAARNPSLSMAQVAAKVLAAARPLVPDQCPRPCGRGLLNAVVP